MMVVLPFAMMTLMATGTVYLGAILSIGGELSPQSRSEVEAETMTYWQALALPLYASACLLVLYFFFQYVQYVMLLLILSTAVLSCLYLLHICCHALSSKGCKMNETNSSVLARIASILLTIAIVCEYLRSGSYVCHDLLGVSLSVLFIATLRFPSVKLATLTLSLLVLYDIFWVFLSEYVFAANVMVTVASQASTNPIHALGQALHLPVLQAVTSSTLQLPIKLILPHEGRFVMLGLGDIALPGAFVALTLRCDTYLAHLQTKMEDDDEESRRDELSPLTVSGYSGAVAANSSKLFQFSLLGYLFGLLLAFWVSFTSQHAQPALIYLVPCTIGACLGRAYACGQLAVLWAGPFHV